MSSDLTSLDSSLCAAPFLDLADYPPRGGRLQSRFCAEVSSNLTCCLPCPTTYWTFSDDFDTVDTATHGVAIVSLLCSLFLLLTFFLLPQEKSHRHYLSIGLCIFSTLLSLAFFIPLPAKPDVCHDAITANDMYSDLTCAWTGAFLLVGAMGVIVWILLRSIWTALRVVWDFKHTETFKWVSIAVGTIVPFFFLGLCLGVTGVSYRLGDVCAPNWETELTTWFGWVFAFAGLSAIITLGTVLYIAYVYTRRFLGSGESGNPALRSQVSASTSGGPTQLEGWQMSPRKRRRIALRRVSKVFKLQWRNIVLAIIVINISIFLATNFIDETISSQKAARPENAGKELPWVTCLVEHHGDKNACLGLSGVFGLSESRAEAAILLTAALGFLIFVLILRRSMFEGWYELLRNPRQIFDRRGSGDEQDFIIISPKRISLGKPLQSDLEHRSRFSNDDERPRHVPLEFNEKGYPKEPMLREGSPPIPLPEPAAARRSGGHSRQTSHGTDLDSDDEDEGDDLRAHRLKNEGGGLYYC